ncbi:MAG: ABC transporter ATP-binding protein [Spirochaetales bacterium]|nr:ABC transporter ATP-binding protein [Spirochaetales bacterium]
MKRRSPAKVAALLEIEDLHIFYDAIEALKGVSLTLDQGEIVTVLGANGAGKSTLLKAVSGLLPIRGGTVRFDGEPINGCAAHQIVLQGISQVPEGRRVFTTLSVEENLNLGAYSRRRIVQEVEAARRRVFSLFPVLGQRRRQLAGTLSGGEQQMLAIGRALMCRPRVLLLDEPSLGLAPILVRQIFRIIREINDQGISILLVEQNAQKALTVARRGYVLETGSIAASGASAQLKSDPRIRAAYLGGSGLQRNRK